LVLERHLSNASRTIRAYLNRQVKP